MEPDSAVENNLNEKLPETFDEMNLKIELLRGIYGYGFEKPRATQQRAIVQIIKGNDVIVQAQSGTGKTAAYLISILQKLDSSIKECQALIIVPARELARGIERVLVTLGNYMQVSSYACVGGTNIKEDKLKLEQGVQIIVGTPGRVLDAIRRQWLNTKDLKMVVLDEADETMSRGFVEQIDDIFKNLPSNIQIALLSATIPDVVLEVTKKLMRNPVHLLIEKELTLKQNIKQFYINVNKEEMKFETLYDFIQKITLLQMVIYCNTRKDVDWLTQNMHQKDLSVVALHSDMNQNECEVVKAAFRAGSFRFLVTNFLFIRNDLHHFSVILNYDLPIAHENYIERIRRTDEFNRKVFVVNLVTEVDIPKLHIIEQFYNTNLSEMPQNINDIIT